MNAIQNSTALFQSAAALAVEMRSANKYFARHQVLKNVDFSVAEGERIVICGPSGSGKSTLIRCLNGLETLTSGDVVILGEKLLSNNSSLRSIRSKVGMVFQSFNLFPHLTVLENCTLALRKNQGMAKQEANELALSFLTKVHIRDQAYKYPSQLSGGQQQRVAIARALVAKPKLMLFDEPTSALDPEMIKEVLQTMIEVADEGMTMIVVTHELAFARKVADRVVFMADGEILETGSPDDLFDRPKNARLVKFLDQVL